MDWIDLTQKQIKGTCECGNERSGCITFGINLTSCKPVSFSRRTLLGGVSDVNLPKELLETDVEVECLEMMQSWYGQIN
jgi:hypothetical protein